ncbi:Hypothetical predicted protein [Mytilus galloprovincialis]|uniref:Uncharacterized protein n=1 Tax=Mytilus galloprovincialis TaxID=29158 RepID=A0A8B6D4G1_MYTGA|nr:Hypothetical predicted protein [Mytilus galloprovincialis]
MSLCDNDGKSFEVGVSKFSSPFPKHVYYDTPGIHQSIVRLLLEYQADVSLCNYKGKTALHIACETGDYAVVKVLVESEADLTVCDNDGNTPLDLACQREHTDVVTLLLNSFTNISQLDNDGKTALHSVCKGYGSRKKDVGWFFVNPWQHPTDTDIEAHKSVIEVLLHKKADINKRNKHGETPLHTACTYGPVDVVTMLLNEGADISLCDMKGQSTVYKACAGGNSSILNILLQRNANFLKCDNDGNSALHVTCKNRGKVKKKGPSGYINFKLPCKLSSTSKFEFEEFSIYKADGFECVFKILVDQNVDLNIRNNCQQTPLHIATEGGHLPLVNMIVERNVDVNVCDNKGQSPLYLACEMRHIDIVKTLLSHNADIHLVDNNKRSPLHAVCNGLSVPPTKTEIQSVRDLVYLLIEYKGDLSLPDNEGKIPLHFACKAGCLAIVESLVVKKAHFTVCDLNGRTPLDEAKKADHCDIVRFLENFEDDKSKNFNLFYFLW